MGGDLFTCASSDGVEVLSLRLPEELDSDAFDQLNEALLRLVGGKDSGRWVMNLGGVSYAGSPILGLLVNLRQQARQRQGSLVLCGVSERLMRIFQACCLEKLFAVYHTQEEAMRRVRR